MNVCVCGARQFHQALIKLLGPILPFTSSDQFVYREVGGRISRNGRRTEPKVERRPSIKEGS